MSNLVICGVTGPQRWALSGEPRKIYVGTGGAGIGVCVGVGWPCSAADIGATPTSRRKPHAIERSSMVQNMLGGLYFRIASLRNIHGLRNRSALIECGSFFQQLSHLWLAQRVA